MVSRQNPEKWKTHLAHAERRSNQGSTSSGSAGYTRQTKTEPGRSDKGMGGSRCENLEGGDDDEEDQVDGVERFFDYLAYQF